MHLQAQRPKRLFPSDLAQDACAIMRGLNQGESIIAASVIAALVLGSFMAACALIAFLVSLFVVACQEYPRYVFPIEGFVWLVLSWAIHRKFKTNDMQG